MTWPNLCGGKWSRQIASDCQAKAGPRRIQWSGGLILRTRQRDLSEGGSERKERHSAR